MAFGPAPFTMRETSAHHPATRVFTMGEIRTGHRLLEYYRLMCFPVQGPSRLAPKALGLLPAVLSRLALLGLVLPAPVLLPGAGCSADLEALFADEQALIAQLPAKPDDPVAAECGMCALQQCEERRLECERDDRCSQLLACKGSCSDPACLFECEVEHAASGKHNNFHTCLVESACASDLDCKSECEAEHQASETYHAYRACVFETRCREECATGQNWQCLGDYSWTGPDAGHAAPRRLTVMVKDADRLHLVYPGAGGVQVYACLSSDRCGDTAWATSNSIGIAVLEDLPADDDNAFDGYLRLSRDVSDEHGIRQIHDAGRPIRRELSMEEVVMPESRYLDEIEPLLSVEPDRNGGYVIARVYDCLAAPAEGISYSLASDSLGTAFYSRSSYGTPGKETDQTGMGGIVNIKLPSVGILWPVIRAFRSSDGALVSERKVEIRADTMTGVDLYPLATSEDSSAR